MLSEAALRTGKRYCSVRFGNVLGSSGSFIPLLKQQIRNGGPITITHQDMTRYFMLIREAVSLVLKASSISNPGDINILRMGEPIRIVDIAKNLITLLGKKESEIPIVVTGIRPGEKMFEELYLCGDEIKTEHPDIVVLPHDASSRTQTNIDRDIEAMITESRTDQKAAVETLMNLANYSGRATKRAA